jgi:lipopolysaccharide transport system ATP-binding protein
MTDYAIELQALSKKFRRGEAHDTLRDLVPAVTRKLLGRRQASTDLLSAAEFWALKEISATVRHGEAVGIIGHNGAGKSTLLKLLTGVLRPTSGRLTMRGRVSALIEIAAGFHPDLTGRENVFLNGAILGMSLADVRRKFDQIVDFSGLVEYLDTPVKRYSSGMLAKLGFSVAAHLDPDILLIDEVLSVGDYAFQKKGVERMNSIVAGGATVVFVSHNLKSVSELCNRCLLLNHGRLLADGPTDAVIHDYISSISRADAGQANEVEFESISVRGASGPQSVYRSGERIYIDTVARAVRATRKLEFSYRLFDHAYYELFSVSTERLGLPGFSLQAGERIEVTISIAPHCLGGTYQLAVSAWRLDSHVDVDTVMNAAHIQIQTAMESQGVVNPYAVLEHHVRR